MNLSKWEERFAPYLEQIELLGEIPLTQTEHAALEKDIAALVQRYGLTEATRQMEGHYPASFVVYLAFKAAFNDERSFWDKVAEVMGVSQSFHQGKHHWGKVFRKIIRQYPNLRQFDNISGRQFITPIRLHGGIPSYSLPDFFRFILLPSVEKAPYNGMEDEQALDELLGRYTTTLLVDSVVRYFFKYGGTPAKRLFRRSRRMARLALENKPLPPPSELGLRPYLVLNFENYLQNPPEPGKRRRRPRLFLDPYQPGFRVLLPPQSLTLEQASQPCVARLLNPDTSLSLGEEQRLSTYRRGQDWLTEEVEWLLDEPATNIQVGVYTDGKEEPLALYSLRLLPTGDFPPLLAARYEDGALRPVSPALTAKVLWLMYPRDAEIQVEGEARAIENAPPFSPPWGNWQAQAWDLTKARLVRLVSAGNDICPPIPVSVPDEPQFVGKTTHPLSLAVDEKPLYTDPPRLRLPLRHLAVAEQELSAWKLRLESRYAACPAGTWEASAAELPHKILHDEFAALIDLTSWLGAAPAGTYHLTIQGSGYPWMEMPFRVCPELSIEGLKSYYLPDKNGAKTVQFDITLPPNARLSAANNLKMISRGQRWRVNIPGDVLKADFNIIFPAEPEDVHIPLQISIPRLRWALLLRPGEALTWHHQPISLPLPELLQVKLAHFRPRLRIALELPARYSVQAELHLRLPGEDESLQVSDGIALSRTFQDFDLGVFFDTLNANTGEGLSTFVLALYDMTQGTITSLPLVHLERDPNITAIHFKTRPDGYLTAHWYEPRPLRYRRLRLWNCWQPWADPVEIPIPDNAPSSDASPTEGWWMHDLPHDIALPPSKYKVQFVIVPPYQQSILPPTPPSTAITVSLISASERLKQIDAQLTSLPETSSRAFALHAEKACIYQGTHRAQDMQKEIKWCLSHWRQANLLHLEALQRWLRQRDQTTSRAFLITMFRTASLENLKRSPPQFIARYLENFPDARTVNPENAHLVLEMAQTPEVVLHALQLLAKSNQEGASNYFWKGLENRRFSEVDAADVLAQQLPFARQLLRNARRSDLRTRLIQELSRRADIPEFMVKVGHYVLSPAGWGKIIKIQQARSSEKFMPDEEHPILLVTLLHWPEQQAELNMQEGRLTLIERQGAYQCACKRFIFPGGQEGKNMKTLHKAFCEREEQERPIPASLSFQPESVIFAAQISNPFDTRSPSGA